MSDSDDDERVSADFASIFALAEMQGDADASSSTHVAKQEKKKICDASDFNPPTQEDLDWNVEVEKEKLMKKTAAFENGKMEVGTALVGRISKDIALPLYETSLLHMDYQNGGAKIMSSDGKSRFETLFPGIANYGLHIGEHDPKAQRCATIFIEGPFLAAKSAQVWPELHEFYKAAQKCVGSKFKPVVSHILFGKSTQVAFQYHWDADQHKKPVHLSFIAELGNSQSTMRIAGEEEMTYEEPGSWKLFDAQLVHRSGVSYADTIKIAIFFEEVDGEGKAVKKNTKGKASSSAAKKKEEKAEVEPEPEEEAEAAEEEEEENVGTAKMEALINALGAMGMMKEKKDREQATEWFLSHYEVRKWVDTDMMVDEYCAFFKGASSSAPPPNVVRVAALGLLARPEVVDAQAVEEAATTTSAAAEAPEAAVEVAEGVEETDPVEKVAPLLEEKEKKEQEKAAGGRVSIELVYPPKEATTEMGANAAGKLPVSHSPPHDNTTRSSTVVKKEKTTRSPTVVKKEKKEEADLVPVAKRPKRDQARK